MARIDDIDLNGVTPAGMSGDIPAGYYEAYISANERKENSKHTGDLLKVTFTIRTGEHAGRQFNTHLNLWNHNPNVASKAKQILKLILIAVNRDQNKPANFDEVMNIPLVIKIDIEKREIKDNKTGQMRVIDANVINDGGYMSMQEYAKMTQNSMQDIPFANQSSEPQNAW